MTSTDDKVSRINATDAEKAETFEWLRGMALNDLRPYAQRRAAIALQAMHDLASGANPSAEGPSIKEIIATLREKNGKRPCDCTSCDCGNSGDTYSAGSWDGSDWILNEIEKALVSSVGAPVAWRWQIKGAGWIYGPTKPNNLNPNLPWEVEPLYAQSSAIVACKYPEECRSYGRCIRPDDHDKPLRCHPAIEQSATGKSVTTDGRRAAE
jgi:hypothetical protein